MKNKERNETGIDDPNKKGADEMTTIRRDWPKI